MATWHPPNEQDGPGISLKSNCVYMTKVVHFELIWKKVLTSIITKVPDIMYMYLSRQTYGIMNTSFWHIGLINSLWPSHAIWWHRPVSKVTDDTKPLIGPMVTSHQWGSAAFIWEQFYSDCPSQYFLYSVWKIMILKLLQYSMRNNELSYWRIEYMLLQYTPYYMHCFGSHRSQFNLYDMHYPPCEWDHPNSATFLPHSWW